MDIVKEVNPHFEDFIFDWDYRNYLLVGGYGSSKSYNIAVKLILKAYEEKRKIMVVREVYDTIRESCYDLFVEILASMDLLSEEVRAYDPIKVKAKVSPMQLIFPNNSRIIFKGLDKPIKLKSINDVSIIWIEEAPEIKYAAFKELIGRLRHPNLPMHMLISLNPVDEQTWVYKHFFKRLDSKGKEVVIQDEFELYKEGVIKNKKNNTYYHHSVVDDNMFVPLSYVMVLNEMKEYDPDLYRIARLGRFGISGRKVLPQLFVADTHEEVMNKVYSISQMFWFNGMDFGFEESYNTVIRFAVDDKEKVLYIFKEYYKNKMTDDRTAKDLEKWEPAIKSLPIVADSAEPKAIKYYQQSGFQMRGARKLTRLDNTRKVKRFRKIICSPECKNTIRELKTLTYFQDRNGEFVYDKFNIDPHTLSAIWYGLDTYNVADAKMIKSNSRAGG